MTFKDFHLDPGLDEAMFYLGFEKPTAVQQQVIPAISQGDDLIACAQTGTGKTAAFVLPVLNKLANGLPSKTNTLIVVPTRELAIQIEQQIQGLSYFLSVSSIAVYGGGDGKAWEREKAAFKSGVHIIVATPGKLLSHLNMGYMDLTGLEHLILDEADRMLDMGFIDDIKRIITHLPEKRQTLMFSATMAPDIRKLARTVLTNPKEVNLAIAKPASGIDQKVCLVNESQKAEAIGRLLSERKDYKTILIFTSTKSKVNQIIHALKSFRIASRGISSDLPQDKREEVLRQFAARQVNILVATDVLSRGIDVKDINMVINFDIPNDAEDYVHRVGRTARVDAKGEAITFITPRDRRKFYLIEKLIETRIPRLELPSDLGPFPSWEQPESQDKDRHGGRRPSYNDRQRKKRPGRGRRNDNPSGQRRSQGRPPSRG